MSSSVNALAAVPTEEMADLAEASPVVAWLCRTAAKAAFMRLWRVCLEPLEGLEAPVRPETEDASPVPAEALV